MNETLKTIHSLRSIHGNFSEKTIAGEDLKTILNACVRSANASARQSYSIIVVDDRTVIKKLSGYVGSIALIFCVDYTRIMDTAKHLNHSFVANDIIAFITGSTDTILAAQTAAIAAKSLGIDSLFTNGIHRGDIKRVYELLDIPEKYCFPLIALILGYPSKEPEYLKGRLTDLGVVHHGKYHRLTKEEIGGLVQEYDTVENHLGLIHNWKEQGFNHYLDWFYTVWSRRPSREQETNTRRQFYQKLKNAGFLNPV